MNIRRHVRNWFGVLWLSAAAIITSLATWYAWAETLVAVPLENITLWFMYMVSVIFTVAAGWFAMMAWYQLKKAIAGQR